ncbi:MAG: winged helix DNA-binding protein [Paracoccaceae bacterium]
MRWGEAAMDAATVKGVVDRLARQGLVATAPDPEDRRRLTVTLTDDGRALFAPPCRHRAGCLGRTLAPLSSAEAETPRPPCWRVWPDPPAALPRP